LVVVGLTATTLRLLVPDDLIARAEGVRAKTLVVIGMTQPNPEQRAATVAAADRKFATHRLTTRVHVLTGGGFLLLAAFQVSRRIRSRSPRTHRVSGRIAIVLAWLSGLTGLFFGLWQPVAGFAEQIVVGAVGLTVLSSTSLAFNHIRAGRVDAHREWMLRAIAAGASIAAQRIVAIPLDLALTPRGFDVRAIFAISLWVGWMLSMAGAEWWIRSTRAGSPRTIQSAA